jgi:hypothetical protein
MVSMNIRIFALFTVLFLFTGCSGKKVYGEATPELKIIRFDVDLYQYLINKEADTCLYPQIAFLDELGQNIINIGHADSAGFYDRLKDFFSEPTLMGLYKDEQEIFSDISLINNELSAGIESLLHYFPNLKQPRIYMHVSGLNQNVIVTDDLLSLSADKYLGADYPLYQDFFYDYERQLMSPDRIVPDYLLGFLMANFPFKGNDEILLDNLLYEGKLRYIISQIIPYREVEEYVGYNHEQYEWCSQNESQIWKLILENKHLFTPNYLTTEQYMKPSPHTASLPVESPGRVGIWLGFQIINSYMKNHPMTSMQELMLMTDNQKILKQSKYKP